MDILLEKVSDKSIFLIFFLRLFTKNIYFLKINSKNEKKLVYKLKSLNVKPLPIEELENIPYNLYSNKDFDPKNLLSKKANSLNSKKIAKLFLNNISNNSEKIVKLLIKDTISKKFTELNSYIDIWLNQKKKLVLITYSFRDLILINKSKNLTIVYLPIDFFDYILKLLIQLRYVFKQLIFKFISTFLKLNKTQDVNIGIKKYAVAYVLHGETYYGGVDEKNALYNKTLYYSNKYKDLKKKNMIHFGYLLNELQNKSISYKYLSDKHLTLGDIWSTLFFILRSIIYVRKFSDVFLISVLAINLKFFLNCRNIFKQYPDLKIAIIDYDFLCPKIIILALMSLNIKTVCAQERFILGFFKSMNILIDDYFTPSNKMNEILKKNKLNLAKNLTSVGIYRADKLSKKIRKKGSRNIIVALGFQTSHTSHDSEVQMLTNWRASKLFLEEMYRLSHDINNCKIIIRLKDMEGYKNLYFKKIINKIKIKKNIEININSEAEYSYKICSKADLVIAKHTSIADECISRDIPVIFHDYTHNLDGIVRGIFDYDDSLLVCKNYMDIFNNTKKFLSFESNNLKKEFQKIKSKYYFYDKKVTVKDKILDHINNYLILKKNKL